ncbi:MAG: response regulator [Deltaproteobacteria bacterium]|nr:response regulator [Deltaproteobacteria bacterium]
MELLHGDQPHDSHTILVVDDEEGIRETIGYYLEEEGYLPTLACDGLEAIEYIKKTEFDLVITDVSMPRMDGFGLMKYSIELCPETPIIILTGLGTMDNAIQAMQLGAYDFLTKPVENFSLFKITVKRALEKREFLAGKRDYRENLERTVAEQTKELIKKNQMLEAYTENLEEVSVSVISSLQAALEEKDSYTAGHSHRVTRYALELGRQMDLGDTELAILERSAKLHDIGKLIVDCSFINKPGPLNDQEWTIMRRHPEVADRFLSPLAFLQNVRPIIRSHHERQDGLGYPDGLSKDELELKTELLTVADSYDAMTSIRTYRSPWSDYKACEELVRCSGTQFSPRVVRAFLKLRGHHHLLRLLDSLFPNQD